MTTHLLNKLLPLSSVQLGRLVLNAKSPQQDFIDPLDNRPAETEFSRNHQNDFTETRKVSRSSKLRSFLGGTISICYERQNDCTATLSASQATTYDLKNSETWFKSACATQETRMFLQDAMDDGRNIYLIVGFRTVQDASLVKYATWKKAKGAKGEVPLQLLATGITSANIVANPGVGGIRDIGNGQELTYKAPGEQVFAILYRKIKFKWLSSRSIKNMALEPNNRWKSCWDWRGPSDEDQILEANLSDDSDLEVSDEEYTSEDETLDHATMEEGFEHTYKTLEKDNMSEVDPADASGMDISDEEHTSNNDTDCIREIPSSLAGMEGNFEDQQAGNKRKRGQDSVDEASKRLRLEMAAAEKSLASTEEGT